jgi:hypothetical protein
MSDKPQWLILTATLPTSPSALRVRVWRALKSTGAATLRDGVYLLPAQAPTAQALWDIERTIADNGADAHMLRVEPRDEAQARRFEGLFDRSDLYDELLQSIKEVRRTMKKSGEAELHRTLRQLEQQLLALQGIDFFPGKASEKAATAMQALRREVELQFSPDEPKSAAASIERQPLDAFQRKTWATRKRPWIDRLATAWLIQRFIDRSPTFVWLADPKKCPKTALGYDFDAARFSHVGDKVTFEVVATTFGLDHDSGIQRVGELVRYLDVGGIPVEEAAGVETMVRGLQAEHRDDDALLAASLSLFDALYAGLQARQ